MSRICILENSFFEMHFTLRLSYFEVKLFSCSITQKLVYTHEARMRARWIVDCKGDGTRQSGCQLHAVKS